MIVSKKVLYRKIGENIKKERKKAQITQKGLSDLLGCSRTSLSLIETGKQHCSIQVIYEISIILKTEPYKFLPDVKQYNDFYI